MGKARKGPTRVRAEQCPVRCCTLQLLVLGGRDRMALPMQMDLWMWWGRVQICILKSILGTIHRLIQNVGFQFCTWGQHP